MLRESNKSAVSVATIHPLAGRTAGESRTTALHCCVTGGTGELSVTACKAQSTLSVPLQLCQLCSCIERVPAPESRTANCQQQQANSTQNKSITAVGLSAPSMLSNAEPLKLASCKILSARCHWPLTRPRSPTRSVRRDRLWPVTTNERPSATVTATAACRPRRPRWNCGAIASRMRRCLGGSVPSSS